MIEREQKIAAMLLSALATTEEADLEDFRRKRLQRGATVTVEDLLRLRSLLHRCADALRSNDSTFWQHISDIYVRFEASPRGPAEPEAYPPSPIVAEPAEPEAYPPSPIVAEPTEPAVSAPTTWVPPASVPSAPTTWVPPASVPETPVPPASELAERLGMAPLPFAPLPFAPLPFAPSPFAPLPFAPLPFVASPVAPSSFAPAQLAPVLQEAETTMVGLLIPAPRSSESGTPPLDDSLPFRRSLTASPEPPPDPMPELTLEAYASLRASCSAFPGRRRDVLSRYGVFDSLMEARLDEVWRVQFQGTPPDAERYAELFAHYREWFETHGDPQWGKS